MAKKKTKKKVGKSHLQFEIESEMKLPDVIDWQEQEVMDTLSSYFKQKIQQGVRYITMAEILKLFGHEPDYIHYKQTFEIADISDEYDDCLGITYNGKYYPMANYSYH